MTIASAPAAALGGSGPLLRFAVRGMTCASCVAHVEKAVRAVPGVAAVSVNLPLERADVQADQVRAGEIVAAIASEGYDARLVNQDAASGTERARHAQEQGADTRSLGRATLMAALLTIPVMVLEMGGHIVPAFHHWQAGMLGEATPRWVALVLATAVVLGPGLRFFRIGLPALIRGRPEMNALVALGAGAAYLYSVVATVAPGLSPEGAAHVYFESAATIITLILLGRWIEAKSKGRTGAAVDELLALQPATATRLRDGGAVETPINEIMVGDLLLVRPGAGLPVDGDVVEGASFVNEAMLTGEATPVAKARGDAVHSGSVNGTGALTIRATRVSDQSLLAGIIRLVEEAQGDKLPIQGRIDQITAVFVPVVLAIAALTFLAWLALGPQPALPVALVSAVSVLIIACPCAMGLATPISVVVATGRAARFGVLFRKGDALERLGTLKVAAFDKTGTLTLGHPELVHVEAAGGHSDSDVIRLAASVEIGSEHPIARAVVEAARTRGLDLKPAGAFDAAIGMGAVAVIDGCTIVVGGAGYMASLGIDSAAWSGRVDERAARAETPFLLAIDGAVAGLLTVADPVKPEAAAMIASLRALGLTPVMISGDHAITAAAVASTLGISEVVANVSPAGKVEAFAGLKARLGPVMFVGDGLNDAPALAAADVGVAVGDGTTVAIESAAVVLVGGHLAALPRAIGLSRATMRNITENLIWAFGYNVALIPLAAGLFRPLLGWSLSPMLAAGAMAFSSIFVVLNALRLTRFGATTAPAGAGARPIP
jgi:heavy metal translocating P-type ATPase